MSATMSFSQRFFHVFTFSTRETVDSPFLRITYLILSFAVIVYTAVDMVVFHRYAQMETPSPQWNIWQAPFNFTEITKNVPTPYCNSPAYDFNNGLGWEYKNISCVRIKDAGRITQILSSEINIKVMMSSVFDEVCPTCLSSYIVGAEKVPFNIMHGIYTPSFGTHLNPRTFLIRKDGSVAREIPNNNTGVWTSAEELLAVSGFSLDQRNYGTGNGIRDAMHRTSGIVLLVGMEYTNYRAFDLNTELQCRITVTAMTGMWGYLGPQYKYMPEYGREVRVDDMNIRIIFQARGEIGVPEGFRTVLRITSGVVMLGMAATLTELLMRLLGDKVKMKEIPGESKCSKVMEKMEQMIDEKIANPIDKNEPIRVEISNEIIDS